jgi:hypothetical protein
MHLLLKAFCGFPCGSVFSLAISHLFWLSIPAAWWFCTKYIKFYIKSPRWVASLEEEVYLMMASLSTLAGRCAWETSSEAC